MTIVYNYKFLDLIWLLLLLLFLVIFLLICPVAITKCTDFVIFLLICPVAIRKCTEFENEVVHEEKSFIHVCSINP